MSKGLLRDAHASGAKRGFQPAVVEVTIEENGLRIVVISFTIGKSKKRRAQQRGFEDKEGD